MLLKGVAWCNTRQLTEGLQLPTVRAGMPAEGLQHSLEGLLVTVDGLNLGSSVLCEAAPVRIFKGQVIHQVFVHDQEKSTTLHLR
eukprot:CAMPEP_0180532420 /NCGR_PEP_ID=MMETSP1036_2-20121128/63053_1 /TAXON_ID=632150 /ORGANISM="Azadinium spinosum, Strain 3D9" /LENGTH=84 /DNA_ID=CAMNT_0022546507 /DNA_START=56 /DNA_END=310 /DNA_ORIENTATION=-